MRQQLIWLAMAGAAGAPAFASLVNLNTSSPFGLVGGTISTTGSSMVNGNVQATTTMTTGPGLTATGTVYSAGDPTAVQAYNDFESAFSSADLMASTASFAGLTTSQTFMANSVNTFTETNVSTASSIDLTFNAQGNANAIFIIRTAGALNVNGGLTFTLENGAQASNIFWIIGTAATITAGNSGPLVFDGNILAGQSFTAEGEPERLPARSTAVLSRRVRKRWRALPT
jgi:type VI secretion system secreted protein VgrG